MDVLVKHNGTNITSSVVAYERVHKICTGIGTLTVEVERTLGRTYEPWDSVDIHENGDFKVKYYISEVIDSVPKGIVTLECQDISKRLVDYFIPDSYTVDYPSYTRYWIEKFLTEAGLDYVFNTTSPGNLLSNFTHMGLVPAYEQLLTLLQLSGWYMYFDGNEKAVIGPLNADLAISNRHVDREDILSISRLDDDKMLRNRALVLGAFDPYSLTYAAADVTVHTRWNYDRRDVRAMVVSNSNIPNRGSAYSIANLLLKEFARPTIEKHVSLHGARDYNLGEAIRVDSTVWRGKGLITTFGTSMSKTGLITNIVIDERCPRLFGFFDFGDYVYVGTFGDGVWKKHIKFEHSWHNFSTGLTNLQITDLHINNGVFGSIGSQGEMYRALEEGPWIPVTITGLQSSQEVIASGDAINWIGFSGIRGRATIVDKYSNIVKFGVDTWSGMNHGDYFLSYSGWLGVTTFSGIVASGMATISGSRGWIVEYDPFTGQPLGGLGSGIYPINVSGNYNIMVIDLENDGYHDYVSVKEIGGDTIPNEGMDWEFGVHFTQPFASTKDPDGYSVHPSDVSYVNNNPLVSKVGSVAVDSRAAMIASDRQVSGQVWNMCVGGDGRARKTVFTREYDVPLQQWKIVTTTTTSGVGVTGEVIGIMPDSTVSDLFHIFTRTAVVNGMSYSYITWDSLLNTFNSSTAIGTSLFDFAGANASRDADPVLINDKIYLLRYGIDNPTTAGGQYVDPSYLEVWVDVIDIATKSLSRTKVYSLQTGQGVSGFYYFFPAADHTTADGLGVFDFILMDSFQSGNEFKFIGWFEIYEKNDPRSKEYILVGNESVVQDTELYNDPTYRFGTTVPSATTNTRLSNSYAVIGRTGASGQKSWYFNGSTFVVETSTGTAPYYLNNTRVFPMYTGNDFFYIAKDLGNDWWLCNPSSLTVEEQIFVPAGYDILRKPFSSGTGISSNQIYFICRNATTFENELVPYNFDSFQTNLALRPDVMPGVTTRGINMGGFFISDASDYTIGSPTANVVYIDLGTPDWQGSRFLVLQREGMLFTIVEEESYPIRIDISNSSPVLAVGSGAGSFVSTFVSDSEVFQVFATPSLSGLQVNDYRYTLLEPTYSGISASGLGVEMTGLYVYGSGVYGFDLNTYSGGFQVIYNVPSGWGTRLETSNFGLGGQYIFVTASGFVPMFYQKDPQNVSFTYYSGLPASRPTIIRLDDRI